jgi:uncharacterized protein Usg
MSDGGLITPTDDFRRQLENTRLATAEILYRLPDHPSLLQSYLWQDLDQIPGFPVLKRFLTYWERELEGKLYRVRVAAADRLLCGTFNAVAEEIPVH